MPLPINENPLRSLLFVPGNISRMIEKSWSAGADAVIFDLEDAVPEGSKGEARETVRKALLQNHYVKPSTLVRINGESTSHWKADIKAVVGRNLQGIVLPKIESTRAISSIERILRRQEKIESLELGSVRLFLLIESARGLINLPELVGSSNRISGLMFGAEDFCLDTGISRSANGNELLYPRSALAICARAFGCGAIDTIHSDLDDTEGLRRECEAATRFGFTGKLAIHPKQIEIIQTEFSPSEQDVIEARRIVEIFNGAQARGEGVILINGKMIDRPVVERARRIVACADASCPRVANDRRNRTSDQ
jgi:citrate lyase subunit beta / citryl-CoA lyase